MGKFIEIREGVIVKDGRPTRRYPRDFSFGFYMNVWRHSYEVYEECKSWCSEQFGEDDPDERWFEHSGTFWFRVESDAIAFKLRWV